MLANVAAQAASAIRAKAEATAPSTAGRARTCERVAVATEYMPRGKTTDHQAGSNQTGWCPKTCLQKNMAKSQGIHQDAVAHKRSVKPATKGSRRSTSGGGSWTPSSVAPASVAMATAPMSIQ